MSFSSLGFGSISPASSAVVSHLRGSALFSSLDDVELDAVSRCVVERSVPAGEVVIHENVPGESLYLVTRGRLKVEKDKDGKRLLLGHLSPGDAFGEMSLISPAPTSASVVAVDSSDLLSIGRLDLNVLLNWNPILAAKMWRSFTELLATRLREMNERMVSQYGK